MFHLASCTEILHNELPPAKIISVRWKESLPDLGESKSLSADDERIHAQHLKHESLILLRHRTNGLIRPLDSIRRVPFLDCPTGPSRASPRY